MRTRILGCAGGLAAMAMAGVMTQAAQAQPAPGYTVVPPAERLTFAGVFADAAIEMKLIMAMLLAATASAVVIWALSIGKVGKADARALAGALGRLKIVSSAGALLGLFGASYVLLAGFIAISNVRPAPSLTVLAPGYAEAAMAVMLGLLASAVAVICERHLEGRIRRAAAG